MENVKAVETLSNIERRLEGIVAAGNNSRDGRVDTEEFNVHSSLWSLKVLTSNKLKAVHAHIFKRLRDFRAEYDISFKIKNLPT